MRTAFRFAPLALALILAAAPLQGCTQESSRMEQSLAQKAFPHDARMARMAEAIASGDDAAIPHLAEGLDLDATGEKGLNLLQWAMLQRNIPALHALMDHGADPLSAGLGGRSAAHLAAAGGSPDSLIVLLERKVDPDARNPVSGEALLHVAVMAGQMDNVTTLLAAGADIEATNNTGDTPLHIAGSVGDTELVLLLIESGARMDARNRSGRSFDDYLFSASEQFLDEDTKAELQEIRDLIRKAETGVTSYD